MNFTYDRTLGVVDRYKVVDIFPYKTKDVNNFIFRDHIPYREGDDTSRAYAQETWRRCVEGHWVFDKAKDEEVGTWVWMMPKLYFYTNLGTAVINTGPKTRKPTYPRLADNCWIIFTYILCCDGFSGFDGDPDFTCNRAVKLIEEGVEDIVAPDSCKKEDGTWKKYVEAWDYLTWFYTLENPRGPLGKALYENESTNGMILASRKSWKTWCLAGGDCAHEFWTNGAMSYEDLMDGGSTVDIFVGSSDTIYVSTFLEAVGTCIDNIPGGKFKGDPNFKKSYTGTWDGQKREPIVQRYRKTDGTYGGSMSEILNAVILPNKAQVVVSKRVKRLYIDEVGLQDNVDAVHNAADSTMKSDVGKMGVFMYSGTGGNVDKIIATKKMYTNTDLYNIYPIPNYWFDNVSKIGLFIPASYTFGDCKDENGNTDVIKGTKKTLQERQRLMVEEQSSLTTRKQNEPLEPSEIYLAGKSDFFERDIIADRIEILEHGLHREKASIYELQLGKFDQVTGLYDVYAEKRNDRWDSLVQDMDYKKKRGELVVYEPPMHDGVGFLEYDNLYKVVYDPKSDLITGSSYGAIIVYKGLPKRQLKPGEMFYNIVAAAKVKNDEDDHHLLFLLLCLWYKSKGQYERTVSGVQDFFVKHRLGWILQAPPIEYMKGVVNTRQAQSSGIVINEDFKLDGLRLLKKFHKKIVHVDSSGRMFKWIETIYDLALLWEMNSFSLEEGNYDMISAMIILMLWLQAEHIPEDSANAREQEADYDYELNQLAQVATRYQR